MRDDAAVSSASAPPVAEVHGEWPADPAEITRIRIQVRHWLAPLGLHPETEDDILLAVSEAADNVVEHAYPTPGDGNRVEVTLWTDHSHLHIEVFDRGRWRPRLVDPGYRGRGIMLMKQMIASVSIEPGPDGTRVLLRHPISPRRIERL